jgi:hypothetical protein
MGRLAGSASAEIAAPMSVVYATVSDIAGYLAWQPGLDTATVLLTIRPAEPERFERAALRWIARFCLERREARSPNCKQQHGHARTSPTSRLRSRHCSDPAPVEQTRGNEGQQYGSGIA